MSEATTIVSFPGFGIGEMELNKKCDLVVAFLYF